LKLHHGFAAGSAALLLAATAVGCGRPSGTPAPSLLTDPEAIVAASLTRFEAASTFHVHGPIEGSVDPSGLSALLGGGPVGISGTLKLDGGSLDGDFDLPRQAFDVSGALPSLFGTSVDEIYVDGYAYTRVSSPLSPAAAKYTRSRLDPTALAQSGGSPGATFGPAAVLEGLLAAIADSGATATLLSQDRVDGRATYHVVETIPQGALGRALTALGLDPAAVGELTLAPVDYWVYDDTLQPAGIGISLSSPDLGSVEITLQLTSYGEPSTIRAPDEDDVATG